MRSDPVVGRSPRGERLPRIGEIQKPVAIQAFVAQLPLEALHVCILDRLAAVDKVQPHALLVDPLIERSPRKLPTGGSPVGDELSPKCVSAAYLSHHPEHAGG